MLNNFENFLVVVATVAAAIGVLFLLEWCWPNELRRKHNDLIGWNVTVIGSTYAVTLGFMLFAVWTRFQTAESDADAEANILVNVANLSEGLPPATHGEVLALARQYADVMLTKEWPAMSRGDLSPDSRQLVRRLWATLLSAQTPTFREQTSLDHSLEQLSSMTERRRLRQLEMSDELPGILWVVLILGAVLTISSACLFGSSEFSMHVIQVGLLAVMISCLLVAIADINRPFQGAVHVDPAGFERARTSLANMR